ncbi:(d)CMP kinase [Mesomycoplasma lagogenitalium]|uniref:Cytidylate kinase n=1 Tax=Mesomycoplasma lagogenitalium TaxID=171286 RepID=A0ABY8LT75_9BACT|nr:(d)CMP kinase [Mesomycoplasma lagogenitalium]WGI36444.1 (d)CMP kinase [Mesomycoplasma lagogenitalium]
MKKINIAIDGPSGVGKSTISNFISKKYGLKFINTGSFYRAVAYYFYEKYNKNLELIANEQFVLDNWKIEYISLDENGNVLLQNKNVSDKLRMDEISWWASYVSKYKIIRKQIVDFLQAYAAKNKGIIMDGRDTTSVVLKDAELKIFLWASPEIRAKRRLKQNKELGYSSDYEQLLNEIKKRDFQDMNREHDPLYKTEDSVLIDSTDLTFEQVTEKVSSLIDERVKDE